MLSSFLPMDGAKTIFIPSALTALLSYSMLVVMGLARATNTKVNPRYWKTYDPKYASESNFLIQVSHNVENHFETPPMFHLACLVLFLTGNVTSSEITIAWVYLASRVAHTLVHVTSNKILVRFATYLVGIVCSIMLWYRILRWSMSS